MSHTCHWPGCKVEVPPKIFMCKPHWFTLPKGLRVAIWQTYRPGQEKDKNPSREYMAVVDRCMIFARKHNAEKAQSTNVKRVIDGKAVTIATDTGEIIA